MSRRWREELRACTKWRCQIRWLALAIAGLGIAPASAQEKLSRYTDLLRLAEHHQERLGGGALRVAVWEIDDHYRPAIVQEPDSRARLGPIGPGTDCRLHFGLAVEGQDAGRSQPLRFRVRLRQGEREKRIFEEIVASAGRSGTYWRERVLTLPARSTAREFWLDFELFGQGPEPEASGHGARGAWGSPFVQCRVARPKSPAAAGPTPVILISIDTLRADHLGVYGHSGGNTPVLDAFARESVVFESAFSVAPWTLPAHASLFTGLYPEHQGAGHGSVEAPLGKQPRTLAEILRGAGYWTIGFSAGGLVSRRNGLGRGFQWWTERTRANLADTLPAVFDSLGASDSRPRFLFLHSYDVHGPYAYLPGLSARSNTSGRGLRGSGAAAFTPEWARIRSIAYHRYQRFERFAAEREAIDAYDAGIRFVDAQLGRLFERLVEIGVYDRALIVVLSDHGESLGDRRLYFGHSYGLFDQEIRVPLLVRLPRARRVERIDTPVSLVDVMPMILAAVELHVPEGVDGLDPLASTPSDHGRILCGEAAHTGAYFLRTRSAKWIGPARPIHSEKNLVPPGLRDRFDVAEQVYDLEHDAAERINLLLPADTGLRDDLKRLRLLGAERQRRAHTEFDSGPSVLPELDPEGQRALRALGYLP